VFKSPVSYILLSIFVLASGTMQGQVLYERQDSLIFEKYAAHVKPYQNEPVSTLMVETAKFFIGTPYVAHTLEKNEEEALVINLREFDCTTFVESCISLAITMKSGNPSFLNFANTLQQLRYRKGYIDGYTSRLHYMSDWVYENERAGIFEDISPSAGGTNMRKEINFMSTHADAYPHLKNNQENIHKIKNIEASITKRSDYVTVPSQIIPSITDKIDSGDIILFATDINGLDYSHVGIAFWENGSLSFIHASSSKKRVIFESQTLHNYCKKARKCTGITQLRLKNN